MKTIHQVLTENGWEFILGHNLGYGRNPDYDNVIVSREEVEIMFKEVPKYFYFEKDDDNVRDEDDAWETFYDSWCDKHLTDNQDIDFKDWENKILERQGV